jgi:streptogramin lyase
LLSEFNFTHPQQIIVDQVGDVWVGEQMCGGASCDTQANLYRIHNGEWSLIIDAAYWLSSFKQLVLDGNGQGWLFWEGMFYRLDGDLLEPISSITARGIDVSPDGSIWVVAGTGDEASLQILTP